LTAMLSPSFTSGQSTARLRRRKPAPSATDATRTDRSTMPVNIG
jgi:hypothetical protein